MASMVDNSFQKIFAVEGMESMEGGVGLKILFVFRFFYRGGHGERGGGPRPGE